MPLNSIRVSALGQSLAFALLVGVLAITPMAPVDAQKGKPAPANQAANITFADRSSDLITSDVSLTYIDGLDGVSATVNASSGDLVVTFGASRHVKVVLGTPIDDGQGPTAGTYAARRLYVSDIKGVPFGAPQLRVARILDFPSLTNHVVGFLATHNSGEPAGGTPVCVTRDSDTEWTVTSTAVADCTPGGIGGLFTQANGKKGTIVITPLARYVLPFSVGVVLQP